MSAENKRQEMSEFKAFGRVPIYSGTRRERTIRGSQAESEPFIRVNVNTAHAEFGIANFDLDQEYVQPQSTFMGIDPIASYRALLLIDRLNLIDPYSDLIDTAIIAHGSMRKEWYVRFLERHSGDCTRENIRTIRRMTPSNLDDTIALLHEHHIAVNGSSIAKEIRRGTIQTSNIYEQIILETQERKDRIEQIDSISPKGFILE